MVQKLISDFFDIRRGELRISIFMFCYIFIVVAVLLVLKPTVSALFLSELGPEQLPFGYLLVAIGAILSSLWYSQLLSKYRLKTIIRYTLVFSSLVLISAAIFVFLNILKGWMLYLIYTWVAIYGVLAASQFWVLANLVFNVRDAKRLFGFIGSGAIMGGLFGGYLTSLLAPWFGNGIMMLLAAALLLLLLPLLQSIWSFRVTQLNEFKKSKTYPTSSEKPFQLVKNEPHLRNLAMLVGISVLVAKLVDYLFSDYAANAISDPDELSSFFGFWFSTFNLVSLALQLFLTQRIVGVWGVGFSLLLLPLGILVGSVFFLFLPELSAVVAIKAMDGVLKQSINKSAFELLALPLPFDLKNRTKSFIDVVIDSLATGIAGILLVFLIKGFEWQSYQVTWLIIALVVLWAYFIFRVRKTYYKAFRANLRGQTNEEVAPPVVKQISVLKGMRKVFSEGSENQILFMLDKLMEINDKRFAPDVRNLLDHPSIKVKTSAIKNLYFLDSASMPWNINELLSIGNEDLNLAAMDFLLLHSRNDPEAIFSYYLEHKDKNISEAALFSLAKESINNRRMQKRYDLEKRIQKGVDDSDENLSPYLIKTIGVAGLTKFHPLLTQILNGHDVDLQMEAIEAVGLSMESSFVPHLVELLPKKIYRGPVIASLRNYGPGVMPVLVRMVKDQTVSIEACRFIPKVIENFGNQEAVQHLFQLFNDVDLSVRLESVRSLSNLRSSHPEIKFNRFEVASKIYEECKLFHQTLNAMHTQIIISYRNRKSPRHEVEQKEREARTSLLELLERRLDAALERIFRLLGLKYTQEDISLAFERLTSDEEELRSNAIDFLDNLLTGNLKQQLFLIIEEVVRDFSSEETIQRIKPKIPSEKECFELLLKMPDLKMQLAVLYLIGKQVDKRYLPILEDLSRQDNLKIRTFALSAISEINAEN
ncbi:hypothetical protein DZC72_08760 [Maribacter algicola]|uniref:ADP,ATP carrier protein n=1 Tax=Maribacter algicola TaxID=2498892 RepID=A0A426RNN6_9FLAO|nr:Npt1/Npt2 family nucleotide transporter [Maribacter algicola]RRQ50608.1 hypothetical protein DZC72_08760 [Maribacter algicola]